MAVLMQRGWMVAALLLVGLFGANVLWWVDTSGGPTVLARAQARQPTAHAPAVAAGSTMGSDTLTLAPTGPMESDTLKSDPPTPASEPELVKPASGTLTPRLSRVLDRSGAVGHLLAEGLPVARASAMAVTETPAVRRVPSAGGGAAFGELDERVMQEILDLRGDQGSLFQGTCLEGEADGSEEAAFLAALRRAASLGSDADGGMGADAASLGVSGMMSSVPHEGGGADCHSRVAVSELERGAEQGGERELVATLRLAARQLDELAASLEEQRRYDAADTTRGQAKKLRRYARCWDADVLGVPSADSSVGRFKRPHSINFRVP